MKSKSSLSRSMPGKKSPPGPGTASSHRGRSVPRNKDDVDPSRRTPSPKKKSSTGFSTPPAKSPKKSPPSSERTASTAKSTSTTQSKRNVASLRKIDLSSSSASPKKCKIDLSSSSASPKKLKVYKDSRPQKDAASSVASSDESVDFSTPYNIDWTSIDGVREAYKYHKPSEDVTNMDVKEQLTWLTDNFMPADMKAVLGIVASSAGYDHRSLNLKSLKTRKQIGPAFVKLVIDVMNARTDIADDEYDVPEGIDVDEEERAPDVFE